MGTPLINSIKTMVSAYGYYAPNNVPDDIEMQRAHIFVINNESLWI